MIDNEPKSGERENKKIIEKSPKIIMYMRKQLLILITCKRIIQVIDYMRE